MDIIIKSLLHITITDIIDIAIIAVLVYSLMMLVRETRAEQLIKGLFFVVLMWQFSEVAGLRMVNYLIRNMMTLGLVALLIVFQPELRRVLEYIGRNRLINSRNAQGLDEDVGAMIDQVVEAVADLAKEKVGVLIAFERETGLADLMEAGTALDSVVSAELLRSIFLTTSPLHDGAVFIRNNRIVKAGAILPLTHKEKIAKDLGTRHRAALGLIERSDAIVVVVSEETGTISIAIDGKLMRFLDNNSLASILRTKFKLVEKRSLFEKVFGGAKNVKDN
ncbi:MAG: TIGR00159 family protein [Clostridiales bacterium]|nr:MAG: TIGR00159 family protein [Clostridiales bacterium]